MSRKKQGLHALQELIIQERKTLKRERQKRWRENKKKLIATENCDEDAVTVSNDFEFPNRMSKCSLLQKHKSCLPQTQLS
jgi:hypothetical protein